MSERKRSWWQSALVGALTLLAMYALSIGPAWRLVHDKYVPAEVYCVAYHPLEILMDESKPVRKALHGYIGLWMPTLVP